MNRVITALFMLCLLPTAASAAPAAKGRPLNMAVIFSGEALPQSVVYKVKQGDTLEKIARRHKTTIELTKIINGLESDRIRAGQELRVWNVPFTIKISKTRNILALKCGKEVVKTYPVSTGADNNTPVGKFKITTRFKDPVWFFEGREIASGDPANALGPRWLGLGKPQYGIHGTIHPGLIGQSVSHGCVRMLNDDVIELYNVVPVGTKVTITD